MKRLLWIFILLLIAIGLAFVIHQDSGYVLISYLNWSIETSLWFAVIAIIILFLVFYFLLRVLKNTLLLSRRLRRWDQSRKKDKASRLTTVGFRELAEGQWKQAEKYLTQATTDAHSSWINFLAAAYAAQQQHAFSQRDHYLQQAYHIDPSSKLAVGFTQAQLQIQSNQWEQALATLKKLQQSNANHVFLLQLLQKVYGELQDWENLKILLPTIKKNKALSDEVYAQLAALTHQNLLKKASNLEILDNTWETIPKNLRTHADILSVYTHSLAHFEQSSKAASLIEDSLKKRYHDDLVCIYAGLKLKNPVKQLSMLENWVKQYPHQYQLLQCAGQLALQEKFLGKAKDYLEDSIKIKPLKNTYDLLALVYEALGDHAKALQCFRWQPERLL